MSIGAAIGGAGLLGAGASIFGASSAANATKQAAAQSAQYAKDAYGQNQDIISGLSDAAGLTSDKIDALLTDAKSSINSSYATIQKLIANIPSVSQEYGTAQDLSLKDFNFRTDLKRQNLDFSLGNSGKDLRESQSLNASLAALDPSKFNDSTNRIINSKLLDLKALTLGEPTGSFANLSAQNLYNFSNQGLSNELAISDFFSKNGTVDPISPLQTAFQLQGVDQSIAGLGIQGAEWQGGALAGIDQSGIQAANQEFANQTQVAGLGINSNNTLAQLLSQSAGASALGQSQIANSIAPAIGMVTSGLTGAYGLNLQSTALNNQSTFNSNYLQYLNQALNQRTGYSAFAPTTSVGAGTSAFTSSTGNSSNLSLPSYSNSFNVPLFSTAAIGMPSAFSAGGTGLSSALFGF